MQQKSMLVRVAVPPQTQIFTVPAVAVIRTPSEEKISASLVSPAPETDPRIQGLAFYYISPRKAGLLPGMNVSTDLPVGSRMAGVILPASAIIWWRGRPWVYLRTGPDRFRRRLVPDHIPVTAGWFVPQGFEPQERIAVVGAQLLLSEEFQSLIRGGD